MKIELRQLEGLYFLSSLLEDLYSRRMSDKEFPEHFMFVKQVLKYIIDDIREVNDPNCAYDI